MSTLVIDLPNPAQLVRGLTLHEVHPPLPEVELKVKQAEERLAAAREDLKTKELMIDRLRRGVAAGASSLADLEAVLSAARAVALSIPPMERTIEEVEESRVREWRTAQNKLTERIARRKEQLQAVADRLKPVLEQLRELDYLLAQSGMDKESVTVGVDWPVSWTAEIRLGSAQGIVAGINVPANARTWRSDV